MILVNADRSLEYKSESPGPTDGVFENSNKHNARGRITCDVWPALFDMMMMMPAWKRKMVVQKIQTRTYRPSLTQFVNATGVCEECHLGSAEHVLNSRSQIARYMIGYANLIGMSVVDSSHAREIMIR